MLYSRYLPIWMSHWRHRTTEGAEFWITCKRLTFLSSFSDWQVIQNKHPWCCAAGISDSWIWAEPDISHGLQGISEIFFFLFQASKSYLKAKKILVWIRRPILPDNISWHLRWWFLEEKKKISDIVITRTRRILKRDRKFTRFSASDAIFRREEKRLVYVIYKGKSKNVQVRAMAEAKSRQISPAVRYLYF